MQTIDFINAFIEDTCVLVVVAYLLTRGPLLTILLKPSPTNREQYVLGLLLGVFGATEYLFPHLRYPYVTQTLFVTFAALAVGGRVGGMASLVILCAALFRREVPANVITLTLGLSVGGFIASRIRSIHFDERFHPRMAFLSGFLTQALSTFFLWCSAVLMHSPLHLLTILWSIPANGVAMLFLGVIVTEAKLRNDAERFRIEAEQAHALAVDFQLAALRSRIHPHFLFNTLTSIAVLCRVAPPKAEQAVLQLSQLMRRALESNPRRPVTIAEEIAAVEAFIAIEKLRLGDRLCVETDILPGLDPERFRIPGFSLLTLVENSVQHGIARRPGVGRVTLRIRRRTSSNWAQITVCDNGKGVSATKLRQSVTSISSTRSHGLTILDQQLRLTYGNRARLHLFSKENVGTLVAFQIPIA